MPDASRVILERKFIMEFAELTPEEKLMGAIFGQRLEAKHFLSDAGRKAINDLLDEFVAIPHRQLTKVQCERGIKVLRLRFGLDPRTAEEKAKRPGPSDTRTLEEVGPYFGVTRERIRQIEAKTLRALRHPSLSRKLKEYLGD